MIHVKTKSFKKFIPNRRFDKKLWKKTLSGPGASNSRKRWIRDEEKCCNCPGEEEEREHLPPVRNAYGRKKQALGLRS